MILIHALLISYSVLYQRYGCRLLHLWQPLLYGSKGHIQRELSLVNKLYRMFINQLKTRIKNMLCLLHRTKTIGWEWRERNISRIVYKETYWNKCVNLIIYLLGKDGNISKLHSQIN
jgi:hypothetical protein